ncbi:MAG: hypothetical protein KJ042_04475 [Deltaproteobacteria bacterium]|nr:hypothetical protein [Deltaproteobacteria bacterium]
MEPDLLKMLAHCPAFVRFAREIAVGGEIPVVARDVVREGTSGTAHLLNVLVTPGPGIAPVIIECRHADQVVGIDALETLAGVGNDIGAARIGLFCAGVLGERETTFARGHGIELFQFEDAPADGLGACAISNHVVAYSWLGNYRKLRFDDATLTPLVEEVPKQPFLQAEFDTYGREGGPGMPLYSVKDGRPGGDLLKLIHAKQAEILYFFRTNADFRKEVLPDRRLAVQTPTRFDFSEYEFRQVRFPYGAVNIKTIDAEFFTFVFGQEIDHSTTALALLPAAIRLYLCPRSRAEAMREVRSTIQDKRANIKPLVEDAILGGDAVDGLLSIDICFPPWVDYEFVGTEIKSTTNQMIVKPQDTQYH